VSIFDALHHKPMPPALSLSRITRVECIRYAHVYKVKEPRGVPPQSTHTSRRVHVVDAAYDSVPVRGITRPNTGMKRSISIGWDIEDVREQLENREKNGQADG